MSKDKIQTSTTAVIHVAAACNRQLQPSLIEFVETVHNTYHITGISYDVDENKDLISVMLKVHTLADVKELMQIVLEDLNISEKELRIHTTRSKKSVFGRDIMAFLLRQRYNYSYSVIANMLGMKTLQSAMISCKKFNPKNFHCKEQSLKKLYRLAKNRYKGKLSDEIV